MRQNPTQHMKLHHFSYITLLKLQHILANESVCNLDSVEILVLHVWEGQAYITAKHNHSELIECLECN